MSTHPECPYSPENDPYHLAEGAERALTDNPELYTKNPDTELVTLAAQDIFNNPQDIDSALTTLREVYSGHLGDKKTIKGVDYETAMKKTERMAVWAPYWSLVTVELARRALPALRAEPDASLLLPINDYPWKEADEEDSSLPKHLTVQEKSYMHTLRTLLFEADEANANKMQDREDPRHIFTPLLPHLDATYEALTGESIQKGLYNTYTGTGGSIALRAFRAAELSPDFNDHFTLTQITRERAQLPRHASWAVMPFHVDKITEDTLTLNNGTPALSDRYKNYLAQGHRGRCIAQFPLVPPHEEDQKIFNAFYEAAIARGATGEGITENRLPGSGEATTVLAIIEAQVRSELLT